MSHRGRGARFADTGARLACSLAFLAIVLAAARSEGAPGRAAKTISIQDDGTIVTYQNGKIVDVDRRTLSAPQPESKARTRITKSATDRGRGSTRASEAAAAPASNPGADLPPAPVLHSLRTHPEPDVPAKRATTTARDLAWILPLILAMLLFLTSYCLFLVAAFQESPWWGLAVAFLPIASLVFLIVHFDKARMALLAAVLGAVLLALSMGVLLRFAPGRGLPWSGAGETTGLRGSLRG